MVEHGHAGRDVRFAAPRNGHARAGPPLTGRRHRRTLAEPKGYFRRYRSKQVSQDGRTSEARTASLRRRQVGASAEPRGYFRRYRSKQVSQDGRTSEARTASLRRRQVGASALDAFDLRAEGAQALVDALVPLVDLVHGAD